MSHTEKPSEMEDEYFARLDFERRRNLEEEKHRKLEEDERKKLKDLHYMRCPKCGMPLITVKYKDLDIDKCTSCHGVWLDSGELEAVSQLAEHGLKKWFSVFKK